MKYKLSILGLLFIIGFHTFGFDNNTEITNKNVQNLFASKSNPSSKSSKQVILITEEQEESSENDSDSSNDQSIIYFKNQINYFVNLFYIKNTIKSHLIENNAIFKIYIYLVFRNIRI